MLPVAVRARLGILPGRGDPVSTMLLLGYLGLVPSALAYGLFFSGLTAVTATTASIVALMEPLAAAVIAVAFLGEQLTITAVVGGVVLLGSVVAIAITERRAATAACAGLPSLTVSEPGAVKPARSIRQVDRST